MKHFKLAFFLSLLLSTHMAMAQNQSSESSDEYFDYELKDVVTVRHFTIATNSVDNTPANDRVANDGITFYVIGSVRNDVTFGKYYLIRFYHITSEPAGMTADATIINGGNSDNNATNYWCISESDFNNTNIVRKKYRLWFHNIKGVIGQLTVPFKIRPKAGGIPSDFTGDFTIGATGGLGLRLSHYKNDYLNLSAGGGLTSVFVDSPTTGGAVQQTTKWSAITGAIALTFDFNGFQVGAVTGFDFVGGTQGQSWVYNNKWWYSVGIGYQFIKPKEK